MRLDNKIIWILLLICLILVLVFALDHVLFPTLPMPEGAPSIAK